MQYCVDTRAVCYADIYIQQYFTYLQLILVVAIEWHSSAHLAFALVGKTLEDAKGRGVLFLEKVVVCEVQRHAFESKILENVVVTPQLLLLESVAQWYFALVGSTILAFQ